MKTACFTGHRPHKLNGYDSKDNRELLYKIRDIVIDHIENKDVDTFISGMALGVDIWSSLIVLKLKETKYPDIKLICAIPCKNQFGLWNEYDKEVWHGIVERADKVNYTSEDDYTPWCLQKRNEWMVDHSDNVIAIWDGTKGGTGNCIKYAKKKNKEIFCIHPKTLNKLEDIK